MKCLVFRALIRASIVLTMGTAAMIGGSAQSRSQAINEPPTGGNTTGQESSAKLSNGKKGAAEKSKEDSDPAAAAYRSLQELESMGYFAAEDFTYRGKRNPSVLEQYNKRITGDDPSAPLVVGGEIGNNYRMSRKFWGQIAQTNQAFAKAWNLLDESGGVNGSGSIELRCRGTLPFERCTVIGDSGGSYPLLYDIRNLKRTLDQRGPGAVLEPGEEAQLRELKASADERLAEYRAFAGAYKTVIAGLDAASGRTERRRVKELVDDLTMPEAVQGSTEADEPPEKLVLRALEVGSKDKAECHQLLKRAGLKKYAPALFNLYVGNCFGYFRTGVVTDGDPVAAANYRKLWLESDGSSAALQAIGEGYLAGVIVARREYLVSLSAHDEMGLGRTVSTAGGIVFSAGDRERRVLAADYEGGLLTMSGPMATEQLTLSNYRVIFEGRGWLPQSSVPGNQQELEYGVNIETACRYFEKAAWSAVENLKTPKQERQREIRVLKRSLEVMGQALVDRKWRPAGDSRLTALAKESAALTKSVPPGTIPEVFLSAVGRSMKDTTDSQFLESLGITK